MIRTTMLTMTTAAALAMPAVAQDTEMDIVETARTAGNFTTLTAAIEQAGLTETLEGEGPFTVFAPTDQAFQEVDSATLEELMMDENQDQLESILTYHVVPESVMSSDLSDGQMVETVNGEELEVTIDGDTVMIDGATVTQADLEASNGVIHVIDTVLMPEDSGSSM